MRNRHEFSLVFACMSPGRTMWRTHGTSACSVALQRLYVSTMIQFSNPRSVHNIEVEYQRFGLRQRNIFRFSVRHGEETTPTLSTRSWTFIHPLPTSMPFIDYQLRLNEWISYQSTRCVIMSCQSLENDKSRCTVDTRKLKRSTILQTTCMTGSNTYSVQHRSCR